MGLDLAEFVQQLVCHEDLQVFDMEVCLVCSLEPFVGLSWVDAFENAKFAEVLQIELKFSDCI